MTNKTMTMREKIRFNILQMIGGMKDEADTTPVSKYVDEIDSLFTSELADIAKEIEESKYVWNEPVGGMPENTHWSEYNKAKDEDIAIIKEHIGEEK